MLKLFCFFSKFFLCFLLCPYFLEAKLPELTPKDVPEKIKEIMEYHATYKELTPLLIKRTLNNYIEELDPTKTYFIETDIDIWLNPSESLENQVLEEYKQNNFSEFEKIFNKMVQAIQRRHVLEKQIESMELPKNVQTKEFKDLPWAKNVQELLNRLLRIRALQYDAAQKLPEALREKSLQRISKRQAKIEGEILTTNPREKEKLILTDILKATASSLDSHTSYFTPDEAAQFVINVQQRLFGIGAQLRDDLNGFTVIKIIEGSPAALVKELKIKDKIIAVNGEPVVGMDIEDAVDLIRGEELTPVVLTVIRTVKENNEEREEKLDITIPRGEVVLKETRIESSYEPFGDGIIAYIHLFSFYQDPTNSSAGDIENEFKKLKQNHSIKGLILDLRSNSGGMLNQAVQVAGLFITKGIVVSIKDENGEIQHLRDFDGKTIWDGPLIVLVNRGSASASEIVAGTLQDYGKALVLGDDYTYGKGSFQTFTLNATGTEKVNPQGEYKVTRGRYYTVSGNTPQFTGVKSDLVIPGALSQTEIGEKKAKYPLENDKIKSNFEDDLSDVPFLQREKIRLLYKFDLQKKLNLYDRYLDTLKQNSQQRIKVNKNYQNFLVNLKKENDLEEEPQEKFGQNDLQLEEAYNVIKDLIILQGFHTHNTPPLQ